MRKWLCGVAVALAAGAAAAQNPHPEGYTQFFMSPCGEPWRAGPGDPYPIKAWFESVDKDHDGSIDPAEFRADFEGFFDALDQDKNGVLGPEEVSFYEHRVAPDIILGQIIGALDRRTTPAAGVSGGLWGGELILAQQGPLGGGLGGGPQYSPPTVQGPGPDLGATRRQKEPITGPAMYGLLNDAEPILSADSNLDGRVTKAEFLAAADRRFKRLDRNGDGKLTLDELPKPMAQLAAEDSAKRKRR